MDFYAFLSDDGEDEENNKIIVKPPPVNVNLNLNPQKKICVFINTLKLW